MHILTLLFITFVLILLQIYFTLTKSKKEEEKEKEKEEFNSKILPSFKKSRNLRKSTNNRQSKKKRSSLLNLLDDISLLDWSSENIKLEKNLSFLKKDKCESFFESEKSLNTSTDSTNLILKKLRN